MFWISKLERDTIVSCINYYICGRTFLDIDILKKNRMHMTFDLNYLDNYPDA